MSEHLADRLNGHSVCQRYRCCEGVACQVEGQSFLNSANRCNLFEVVVTLLIGGYREQSVVAATTLVFCQNLQRDIQEGYIYRCRGLLAVCAKPRAVIRASDDVFVCECSRIAVGKTREAAKYEYIAYLLQALRWHRLLHQDCQLLHCEVTSLGMFIAKLERCNALWQSVLYTANITSHFGTRKLSAQNL